MAENTNQKTIVLLTKEYESPELKKCGGTGFFYKALALYLTNKNYHVLVFGSGKQAKKFIENDVEICFIKDFFRKNIFVEFIRSISGKIKVLNKLHFWLYLKEKQYLKKHLSKLLENNNIIPYVVESHDFEGISLASPYPDKTIIRCHGSWGVLSKFYNYKKIPIGKIYMEDLALKKTKNIIAVSNTSKKLTEEVFSISKPITVIHNGIDVNKFSPMERTSDCKTILFVGTTSTGKGADVAFDVFIELQKENNEILFKFAGDETNLTHEFKKKLSVDLMNNFVFLGRLTQERLKYEIANSDVIIMPSKGENFSLSLLEVMAMKKSVVTSDIPAFKEIIKHGVNGYIAKKDSEYVYYCNLLLNDFNINNSLAENAYKTVISKFTLDKMGEKTLQYYHSLNN